MLELFVDATLAALAAGETVAPAALTVLLRVYAASGDDSLGAPLARAIARAAAGDQRDEPITVRADWLRLYAEASRLSDDPRLASAAESIAAGLTALSTAAPYGDRVAALGAVLAASPPLDAQRFAAPAVDELEQLVAADYAPGAGLRGRDAAESVAVALALLSAFDLTGRLAYPMLAEELVRAAAAALGAAPPAAGCAAARVLGRLALLHDDPGYRATAVVAPAADYAADRNRLLGALALRCASPSDAAAYALAVTECAERS